jgi:ABC-type antimicrobial peptide transport system permease subunit
MSHRRFLVVATIMVAVLVMCFSIAMYVIDPLFYYRKGTHYRPWYGATERYQMAGLLRTMDYDTMITGTSMGRNFRESYVNQKLGGKSFNASLPASTAHEQSMVAQTAFRNKSNLNRVIWEINYYSFSGNSDWVAGPPSDFPTYLYDKSKLNDIRYLFNSYSLKVLNNNIVANRNGDEGFRDIYSLYKFGQVAPVENIDHINSVLNSATPIDQLPDNEKSTTQIKSFKENVISLIKEHPKTKFILFYAPYSIYNHVSLYKKNNDYLTERLKFKKEVYDLVKKYPNVELYDFQDMKEITFNIENYQGDTVHYYDYINKWIIDYFEKNIPIQSEKEYAIKLQNLKNQVTHFNISQLKTKSVIREQYTKQN